MTDNQVETSTKIAISGTLVFRDKDENVVKETPFTGQLPVTDKQEDKDDGNLRE